MLIGGNERKNKMKRRKEGIPLSLHVLPGLVEWEVADVGEVGVGGVVMAC